MTDFDERDIREFRREGSLRDFLRLQQSAGRFRPDQPTRTPPPAPPGHRPGAWPSGCQRPQPPPPIPDTAVREALAEYRSWLLAGRPPGAHHCECSCTPFTDTPRSPR